MKTYSYLSFAYALSLLATVAQRATTKLVLPTPTGLWYDYGADYQGLDSCGAPAYLYRWNVETIEGLFYEAYGTPPCNGCTWDVSSLTNDANFYEMPPGFVTDNPSDWSQIILDPANPVHGQYSMNIMYEGEVQSRPQINAYPVYDCPAYTRLSYDNVTLTIGCSTTPTLCMGDTVGRDLNLPSPLQPFDFLGHVGLVATWGHANPNILEVLNRTDPDISGIFLNPLYGENSFTTQSKYWGARYEPQEYTRLLLSTASAVIQAGVDQIQYPLNYTIGWDYYPGGTSEHPYNCKFRCDALLYYCFNVGGNIKLQLSFSYPLSIPRTMFNYDLLCSADPVEHCSTYAVGKKKLRKDNIDIPPYQLGTVSDTPQRPIITTAHKIFQSLRPALATKLAQSTQLPDLINQYQAHQNSSTSTLFMRCLCFELNKMTPEKIDNDIRATLSDLLSQHKYLSRDNFLLMLMKNALSFYQENPRCDWLSAFFTVKTEAQTYKEIGMSDYLDQQKDTVEKAHLITASRFSAFSTLTDEKRRAYGSLFRQTYLTNTSLSDDEKQLLRLGLSEMKTSINELKSSEHFFQKARVTFNQTSKKELSS